MEADEEADIVIGDKRELLCDTVTEFTDMEIGMSCNELTFLRQERSGEFSISVQTPSNARYELQNFGKNMKSEESTLC